MFLCSYTPFEGLVEHAPYLMNFENVISRISEVITILQNEYCDELALWRVEYI